MEKITKQLQSYAGTGGENQEWAIFLANRLNEPHRVKYYLRIKNTYSIDIIKKALEDCFKVPDKDIRKNRAALFTYFLKLYAQRRKDSFSSNT